MRYLRFTNYADADASRKVAYKDQVEEAGFTVRGTESSCKLVSDDKGNCEIHVCDNIFQRYTQYERDRMTDTPTIEVE